MNEVRKDLGYQSELPSEESRQAMLRILSNQPPKEPEPDWKLSEDTKQTGLEGIAHTRAVLEAKRKHLANEALSPDEVRILTDVHNQEHPE
jgi:hypothetical protein